MTVETTFDRIQQRQIETARVMRIEASVAQVRVNAWAAAIAAATDEEIVDRTSVANDHSPGGDPFNHWLVGPLAAALACEKTIAQLQTVRMLILEERQADREEK